MSRSLLLASFLALPLLATACTDPAYEPPHLFVYGDGFDDDGVWYLPGHADLLTLSSDPYEARPELVYRAEGDIAMEPARVGEVETTLALQAEPEKDTDSLDGAITIEGPDGDLVQVIPTHVRLPDRIHVVGAASNTLYMIGDDVRVLEGDVAGFGVSYAFESHTLAGSRLIEASGVVDATRDDNDSIRVEGRATPYDVRLDAGPSAGRTIEVSAAPVAEVTLSIDAREAAATAGDSLFMYWKLEDREGEPVMFGTTVWTKDGVTVDWPPSYTYDPAAPPSTITMTVGREGNRVSASTVIHARP